MSEEHPESITGTGAPAPRPRSRKLVPWILVLVGAFAGSWFALAQLREYADLSDYDPSPIPRPTANAPFIVTPDKIVNQMIETAQIEADDLVYDLGCGDGRLVITAAVQKGCRGIGFDIEPERVAEAQANVKLHDVESLVEIRLQDVFKVDLSEADVVLMYLLPQMLRDLKPQFAQCRPGTRLVSHDFQIEGVQVDRTVEVFLPERHFVHLYVTPLKPLPPQSSPRFEIK